MRSRMPLLSTLSALLLFVVASACALGGSVSTGTTGRQVSRGGPPSQTATSAPADPEHLVALNRAGDADVLALDGKTKLLHVHINGVNGVFDDYPATGINCDAELVWASSRPDQVTYSAVQLQSANAYLHTVPFDRFDLPIPATDGAGVTLPDALRWVNAAHTSACLATLQVTNTSATTIVISQVGVHYLAAPIANTYQYAEIDACTIDPARYCVERGGQAGVCAYQAEIHLSATGVAGKETFGGISPNNQGCPTAVPLSPGQFMVIHVTIDPPSGAPALIYQIAPTLTISGTTQTDTTEHVVVVTAFRSNLAFTNPAQFACYGESDGHVVPDSAIHYPLTDAQGNRYSAHLCI